MSKWSLKLFGGAVETTGTSSTISVPTNRQNYGVTYSVKYEDNDGNTGETSIRQAAGANTLKITNIVISNLSNQPGYGGLVAYNNITGDISVSFKYEYSGNANDVQPSWFKFSLQDKNGNQMAVLENPTLNKSSHSGTVAISQAVFANLPSGEKGNSTHTISQYIDHVGYIYNVIDYDRAAPLSSPYYNDPDDKMALYSVVADTRTKHYNTLVYLENTTPTITMRASNIFLKATSTPEIVNLRVGAYYVPPISDAGQPYYTCLESYNTSGYVNISPYCRKYYEGTEYTVQFYYLSFEWDAAGVIPTAAKTTFQICNTSDDSVIHEVELGYNDNPVDPSTTMYWASSYCGSSNVFSTSGGISFKDVLGFQMNTGIHEIYVRWKDKPSIRTITLRVDTTATYCGF
jgi:hypothetical protein